MKLSFPAKTRDAENVLIDFVETAHAELEDGADDTWALNYLPKSTLPRPKYEQRVIRVSLGTAR